MTSSGINIVNLSGTSWWGACFTLPNDSKQYYINAFKFSVVGITSAGYNTCSGIVSAGDVCPGGATAVYHSPYSQPTPAAVFNINPATVDFGQVNVGSTATRQFTVTNGGSSSLSISDFAISGAVFDASTDCITSDGTGMLAVGGTCTVEVTFTPNGSGAQSGSITFTGGSQNRTVPLSGTGVAAAAMLKSLSVACPTSLAAGKTGSCTATAGYSDGSSKSVTPSWSSSNSALLSISANGGLVAGSASTNTAATISASYTEGGYTQAASQSVTVVAQSLTPCTGAATSEIEGSGSITSRVVTAHLTVDCNDVGKNGTVIIAANIPGAGWNSMDGNGAWRPFDTAAGPNVFKAEVLASHYDVTLVNGFDLSALVGTDVWIVYKLGGLGGALWLSNLKATGHQYTIAVANAPAPTPTPTSTIDSRLVGTWSLYGYSANTTYLYAISSFIDTSKMVSCGTAVIGSDGSVNFHLVYGTVCYYENMRLTPYSGHAGAYGVIKGITELSKFYLYYNEANGTLRIEDINGNLDSLGIKP